MTLTVETEELRWFTAEESDNDRYVKQDSFVLAVTCHVDEHGQPTGVPAEGLRGYVTDRATKSTATFKGIRAESQIVDGTLEGQPAIFKEAAAPDPTLLGELRSDWLANNSTDLTARRRYGRSLAFGESW